MTRSFKIGTYAGSTLEANTHVSRMEQWLGRTIDVQHVFTSWDPAGDTTAYLFEELLPTIFDAGRIPLVTWEPFTPTPASTSDALLKEIYGGDYDQYIRSWAASLNSLLHTQPSQRGDKHVFIRLAHEANGDWYPWSPKYEPSLYVKVWRYVCQLVRDVLSDASKVRWVWAINHVDAESIPFEALYPGDEYVDVLGVDGFNWGASQAWSEWQSVDAIFGNPVNRLRQLTNKPVWITEIGCTTNTRDGRDTRQKNQWIRDAFNWVVTREIQLVCWFDVDKETDWAVFGGQRGESTWRSARDDSRYEVYPAFRDALTTFLPQ